MIFSEKLKKFENIKHCFFSRKNGFSTGRYASLNCGLGSGDKKENVLKKNTDNVNIIDTFSKYYKKTKEKYSSRYFFTPC